MCHHSRYSRQSIPEPVFRTCLERSGARMTPQVHVDAYESLLENLMEKLEEAHQILYPTPTDSDACCSARRAPKYAPRRDGSLEAEAAGIHVGAGEVSGSADSYLRSTIWRDGGNPEI